jgi:DNA-binding CsgD family transcriptional regulator
MGTDDACPARDRPGGSGTGRTRRPRRARLRRRQRVAPTRPRHPGVSRRSGGRHPQSPRSSAALRRGRGHRESHRRRSLQIDDAGYEGSVVAVRDTMGDNEFESAWTEGAALSTEGRSPTHSAVTGGRKRPTSGWASRTPTELDVVRLVSEGFANNDIATRLLISPRTVQTHLTNVYTKTGPHLARPTRRAGRPTHLTGADSSEPRFSRARPHCGRGRSGATWEKYRTFRISALCHN